MGESDSREGTLGPVESTRGTWSVMIPTFNCANYLRVTLESVLAQDPGPGEMQIEVVDDCSTTDDPEAVVREVGGGRVSFFRKQRNEGATANFNTCIERSHGDLVHILHGDDYVLGGFYARMGKALGGRGNVAMACCRSFIVDESGGLSGLSARLRRLELGEAVGDELFYENGIRTPAVVVRRSFYEQQGGFRPELMHVADWEMWARAAVFGGCIMINEPLCCYRDFSGNDTSRTARSGENIRDWLRLGAIFEREGYPGFDAGRFRSAVVGLAWGQMGRFEALGDREAYENARRAWWALAGTRQRMASVVRRFLAMGRG